MHAIGAKLDRIDPDRFLGIGPDPTTHYINLVTTFPAREHVCRHLDVTDAQRFSFLACAAPNVDNIKPGCLLYPGTVLYPSAVIEKDVLIHANSLIAHKSSVEQGCFISGQVVISGSVTVGEYSWLGVGTVVSDHVSVAARTTTCVRSVIIENIVQENTIYKKHK
jgi:UDP-3-O-[3-hydroxymyristoyl] glucosamine N-acyltransferase